MDFRTSKKTVIRYIVIAVFAGSLLLAVADLQKCAFAEEANSTNFKFSSLKTSEEFIKFARERFPKGTSRKDVETVLVTEGGASARTFNVEEQKKLSNGVILSLSDDPHVQHLNPKTMVNYSYGAKWSLRNASGWQVFAFYDDKDQLVQMISNSKPLFPDKP